MGNQRVYDLSHRITGLEANTQYQMSVRASNGAGNSNYSINVSVTTDMT